MTELKETIPTYTDEDNKIKEEAPPLSNDIASLEQLARVDHLITLEDSDDQLPPPQEQGQDTVDKRADADQEEDAETEDIAPLYFWPPGVKTRNYDTQQEFCKFMFGVSFDTNPIPLVAETSTTATTENNQPAPLPHIITIEELEAAKEEAYSRGTAAGKAEAMLSIENSMTSLLTTLQDALPAIIEERANIATGVAREAAKLGHAIAKRLFPELSRRYGLNEIEVIAQQALSKAIDHPRLVIRVAPESKDRIASYIERLAIDSAYPGHLFVFGDPALSHSDLWINWGDGGIERMTKRLWDKIDAIVIRITGTLDDRLTKPDFLVTNEASPSQIPDVTNGASRTVVSDA